MKIEMEIHMHCLSYALDFVGAYRKMGEGKNNSTEIFIRLLYGPPKGPKGIVSFENKSRRRLPYCLCVIPMYIPTQDFLMFNLHVSVVKQYSPLSAKLSNGIS